MSHYDIGAIEDSFTQAKRIAAEAATKKINEAAGVTTKGPEKDKKAQAREDGKKIADANAKAKAKAIAKEAMLARLNALKAAGLPTTGAGASSEGEGGGDLMSGNMPLILGGVALAGAAFWYIKRRK